MHDLQPEGSALFGAEPSFKSDFSLDPEEARAQAASRRASRMQSREASVAPVESLGILSTCSVSTEQYIDILILHLTWSWRLPVGGGGNQI